MTTADVYGYILRHRCILGKRAREKLRALARTDPDGAFMQMLIDVERKWGEMRDTMRQGTGIHADEWEYHQQRSNGLSRL